MKMRKVRIIPISGFISECAPNARTIVSQDKRGRQKHIAKNNKGHSVNHYTVDGKILTTGLKCDFLLMNETKMDAYLIELKGSDLVHAAKQLDATHKALTKSLSGYNVLYRIISNRCSTHEIRDSEFLKFKNRWKSKLKCKSNQLEDDING